MAETSVQELVPRVRIPARSASFKADGLCRKGTLTSADLGIIHSVTMWLELHGDNAIPEAVNTHRTLTPPRGVINPLIFSRKCSFPAGSRSAPILTPG